MILLPPNSHQLQVTPYRFARPNTGIKDLDTVSVPELDLDPD